MGRWTEQTKEKALRLMAEGEGNSEIAISVGMSESSITSLRYGVFKKNEERIKCEICGEEFKQIRNKHLLKHNTSLEEYKVKYPNAPTCTESRKADYKNFKSANKGKTYEEIYGKNEGEKKKKKISQKQIGRPCAKLAGTGITGTRRDTETFARSTYEANIDRIFHYEGLKYADEFSEENERFTLNDGGLKISYQPDRIDLDGLICKGAYLEIKGYMYPEDWKKIRLFREQNLDKKLLVICPDLDYADVDYKELESKYKDKIELWEIGKQNYKTRPDLYKVGYVEPERVTFLKGQYPDHINKTIIDDHKTFIANKCISYNAVSLGNIVDIHDVRLVAITNRRFGAKRKSSGVYNYELWEVTTETKDKFYVTNQSKTVQFYCYKEERKEDLLKYFYENCDMSLPYGKKIL
jgi:hypothetical protein